MTFFNLIRAMFSSAPRETPRECAARVRSGAAILVDVREPREWSTGVAEQAVLLPLSDLAGARAQWKRFLAATKGNELLLYCGAGVRSGMAARILTREGIRSVNTGSLADWAAAGWAVVSPGGSFDCGK